MRAIKGIGHVTFFAPIVSMKTNQKLSNVSLNNSFNKNLSHGGSLRNLRKGRSFRPLSTKEPLHLVFKINKTALTKGLRHPKNYSVIGQIFKKYAKHFFIRIEQLSIQNDHIHCLIRAPKRRLYLNFFRVVAGQISQRLQAVTDTPSQIRFWKHRPFSRIVRGLKAYGIIRNYIQLNEKEALGIIRYTKNRLKGLSSSDWKLLWS